MQNDKFKFQTVANTRQMVPAKKSKKNPKPVPKKILKLFHTHLAWQAWHLASSTLVWRGRRGTWRHLPSFCVAGVALVALGWLCWRAWTGLVAGDAAAFCVAGVALGDIYFGFAWQAWHLVTIYFGFAWQACHLRHWAGSGGALGPD